MNKLVPIVAVALAVLYFKCCKDKFEPASIKDKRVLITGASSGIGEHVAYQYSKLGARVFITARRLNLLEKVAAKCKELGAKQVEFVTTDLGEQVDRDKVILEVKKRFGGLDHLILNHAIVSNGFWLGTKENMTTLMKELNVNFISFVDIASQALPMLTESKGNIGVVSSVAGKIASAALSSYCTDKHAMQGFFSALRQELLVRNTGVSVTTCVIGPVDTDIMKVSQEKKEELLKNFSGGFNFTATAEDTADAIMRGVANRKYEIYYGRIAYVVVAIHKIFPSYIEDYFSQHIIEMQKILNS